MRVDFERTWPPFNDFVQMLLEAGLYFDGYEATPERLRAGFDGSMFYIVSLISNTGKKKPLGLAWISDITPPHFAKVNFVADRAIRDESVLSKAPAGNAPSLVKRDIWLMFETICFDALGVSNIIAEAIEGQVTARMLSGLGIHQVGVIPKMLSITGQETATELGIAIYAHHKENSLVSTLGDPCPDRTIAPRTGRGNDRKRDHSSRIDPGSAQERSASGDRLAPWSGRGMQTVERQRYREGSSVPPAQHDPPADARGLLPDEGSRSKRRRGSRGRGRKRKS